MQSAKCVLCLVCVSRCPCHHLPLCQGQVELFPPTHSAGEWPPSIQQRLLISHITGQQLQFLGCAGRLCAILTIVSRRQQNPRGCFNKEGPGCCETQHKKESISHLSVVPRALTLRSLWESCGEPLSPEGLGKQRTWQNPSLT